MKLLNTLASSFAPEVSWWPADARAAAVAAAWSDSARRDPRPKYLVLGAVATGMIPGALLLPLIFDSAPWWLVLVLWAAIIGIATAAAVLKLRALRRSLARLAADEGIPVCRRCRYWCDGLDICPECGGALHATAAAPGSTADGSGDQPCAEDVEPIGPLVDRTVRRVAYATAFWLAVAAGCSFSDLPEIALWAFVLPWLVTIVWAMGLFRR